jgi:hypothetical protein
MRWFYLLAGLLCAASAFIHAVSGGIDTLNPVMATELPFEVRAGIISVWHALTLLLVLATLSCFWAFGHKERAGPLGAFLGLFLTLYGAIVLALSYQWFENPMALPLWTLLGAAGLFSLLAAY